MHILHPLQILTEHLLALSLRFLQLNFMLPHQLLPYCLICFGFLPQRLLQILYLSLMGLFYHFYLFLKFLLDFLIVLLDVHYLLLWCHRFTIFQLSICRTFFFLKRKILSFSFLSGKGRRKYIHTLYFLKRRLPLIWKT